MITYQHASLLWQCVAATSCCCLWPVINVTAAALMLLHRCDMLQERLEESENSQIVIKLCILLYAETPVWCNVAQPTATSRAVPVFFLGL